MPSPALLAGLLWASHLASATVRGSERIRLQRVGPTWGPLRYLGVQDEPAALRRDLGAVAFWDGLRSYTRAHAGGLVESRDLQRAMEAAAGHDLAPLFTRWVDG